MDFQIHNFHKLFLLLTFSSGFKIWFINVLFLQKEIGQIWKKRDQIWIFHDLLGARQHSPKSNEKKNLHL